ncbi:MAG: hypothetical protein LBR16_02160 [Treponema sp.]|jgi:hypothetical protein|nr:hypothetical protein [Treponema sp.]
MKQQTTFFAVCTVLRRPFLWGAALKCLGAALRHFFGLQYWAVLFPRRIPVSNVDHPLDEKIPFLPERVDTYLDFSAFWIREAAFLLRAYGKRALPEVRAFIASMGSLYVFAARVYRQNLSTTKRPPYRGSMGFRLIHAFDPHLLCVPSLHVCLVIRTYTRLRAALAALGGERDYAARILAARAHALAITGAVLYVKQHSVNCIAAALYTMSRFDPPLFPPAEAEAFTACLLTGEEAPSAADRDAIKAYITGLYHKFRAQGEAAPSWEEPLLAFLGG